MVLLGGESWAMTNALERPADNALCERDIMREAVNQTASKVGE
jgi:hypothetical protein